MPTGYRTTAIQILGQVNAEAGPALPALHRAAQSPDETVAGHAKEAARLIRVALE